MLILGIGLGVGLVVSIDIANSSVEKSFRLSTESLAGRTTHRIVGTYGDIDQSVYVKVRRELAVRSSAPVVVGSALVKELERKRVQLLGVDPLAERGFRNFVPEGELGFGTGLAESIVESNRVMIFQPLAAESGLRVGDTLTLLLGEKEVPVTIGNILRQRESAPAGSFVSSLLYMDISVAQEILGKKDRISHIDLIMGEGEQQAIERIEQTLPDQYRLVPAGRRSTAIRRMSKSFEFNLQAFSLLALLVGMFLIYNTMTFSIVRRRELFGILRALGATRGELLLLIFKETALIALIGTALGLLLGMALGTATVRMVGWTVGSLYFPLIANQFTVDPLQMMKAFGLGMAVSFVSTVFPALEANRIQPAEAIVRSKIERRIASWLPIVTTAGLLLVVLGFAVVLVPSKQIALGFAGTASIVFGFSLCVPGLLYLLSYLTAPIVSLLFGVTGKMAIRNIPRAISRTGVSVAALMVAVCVYIGVGLMIASFQESLVRWMENQLRGDFQIASLDETDRVLKKELIETVKQFRTVERIHRTVMRTIASGEYAQTTLFATDQDIRNYGWVGLSVPMRQIRESFVNGTVFVSETFAWKHDIDIDRNPKITLVTPGGIREFAVGGIFSDFFVRGGRLVMHLDLYHKLWRNDSVTNIELFLKSGSDGELLTDLVARRFADEHIGLFSQAEFRYRILKAFDNTFAITVALQLLSAFVAFIGIFNTILALTYERLGEIGVLRANGLTVSQLWRLILIESGAMGLFASLLAIPLGSVLAWILVAVINKRSFGWTLHFQFQGHFLLQAILLSLSAALLAGIYPALKSGRLKVIDAIRTE